MRRQLLKLRPELNHLLGELPVHELLFALGLFQLGLRDLTGDKFLHRTISRKQFLNDAGRKVYAGLGQHGMHDLGRALKVGATGGVITQTRAAQALLILLVTQRPGFLVALNELQKLAGDHHHVGRRHVLSQVRIELGVLGEVRLVKRYGRRAVIMLLNVALSVGLHLDFRALFVFIHGRALHV